MIYSKIKKYNKTEYAAYCLLKLIEGVCVITVCTSWLEHIHDISEKEVGNIY